MPAFDGALFGKEMVTVVKNYVTKALKPITDQLNILSQTFSERAATTDSVIAELQLGMKTLSDANAALQKQIDELNSAPLIAQSVDKATANALKGWNDDVRPTLPTFDTVKGLLSDAVQSIREDVLTELTPLAETEAKATAEKLLLGIPVPPPGKDGVSVVGAALEQDGTLKFFLSNGEQVPVGKVFGNLMTPEDIAEVVQDAFEERDAKTTATLEELAKEVAETAELLSNGSAEIPELVSSAIAKVKSEIVVPDPVAVVGASIMEGTGFLQFELSDGKSITLETDLRGKDAQVNILQLVELIGSEVRKELDNDPERYRGEPGKDAEPVNMDELVDKAALALAQPIQNTIIEHLSANVETYRGMPGKSIQPADIDALVETLTLQLTGPVKEALLDHVEANAEKYRGLPGKDAEFDYDALTQRVVTYVSEYFETNKAQFKGDPGEAGKVDKDELIELITNQVEIFVVERAADYKGEPGKDADPIDMVVVSEIVVNTVNEKFTEMAPQLKGEPGEPGQSIKGEPGKDADPEIIKSMVATAVVTEFEARKSELKGDVGEKGEPGQNAPPVEEIAAAAAKLIPVPKDGVSLAGAVIDRDGELIVTLSNGAAVKLGPVVGKDVDMVEVTKLVQKAVDDIPRPKDGLDGVNFDDMDVVLDWDSKELVISASNGDNAKQWKFFVPFLIDKGVYKEGSDYLQGDGTTFGGSFWIAQKETNQKPGTGEDWRLSVKKGRDGKDAVILGPQKPVKLDKGQ